MGCKCILNPYNKIMVEKPNGEKVLEPLKYHITNKFLEDKVV